MTITRDGYDPKELTVEAGQTVTFVNRSGTTHSAKDDRSGPIEVSPQPGPTAHDGSEVNRATKDGFATHSLFADESQKVVFPVERRYVYASAFDQSMRGVIEVVTPE